MDTRLQLEIAEEGEGNKKTEHWAYAPSLSLSKKSWTPKVVLFLFVLLLFYSDFFIASL
jgi:hypothetical protein